VLLGLLSQPTKAAARDRLSQHPHAQAFEGIAPAAVGASQTSASGAWLTGQDPDGKRVAKLRLPVLVGGGEHGPPAPLPEPAAPGGNDPRAALISYADASHGFFIQHADDFLPRLNAFLTLK